MTKNDKVVQVSGTQRAVDSAGRAKKEDILAFRIAYPYSGLKDHEIPEDWENLARIASKDPGTTTAYFSQSFRNSRIAKLPREGKKDIDSDDVRLAYNKFVARRGTTWGVLVRLAREFKCSTTTISNRLKNST